jgi:hypothetical protein
LRAVYVSGQYGVILPANFLKEKEGVKLKVYNKECYSSYIPDFTSEVSRGYGFALFYFIIL